MCDYERSGPGRQSLTYETLQSANTNTHCWPTTKLVIGCFLSYSKHVINTNILQLQNTGCDLIYFKCPLIVCCRLWVSNFKHAYSIATVSVIKYYHNMADMSIYISAVGLYGHVYGYYLLLPWLTGEVYEQKLLSSYVYVALLNSCLHV